MQYELGCQLPLDKWVWLNRVGCFEDSALRQFVSPFPPPELMQNVSGLISEKDFASHGVDIFIALSAASPHALTTYERLLDFGCGCGRLARMFKGYPHELFGCDIDRRHIDWVRSKLSYIKAEVTSVTPPLPYSDNLFDAIVSISIFTHLNEEFQDKFLRELWRVSAPESYLFLTVHGRRALDRAVNEKRIREMIAVEEAPFQTARDNFSAGQHGFILQQGHLTTSTSKNPSEGTLIKEPFEYGITFIPEDYLRRRWGQWFKVIDYRYGAIHDFQDTVVLVPKK